MKRLIVHQLVLNGIWCACAFGALWGLPWLGVAAAMPWLVWDVHHRPACAPGLALIAVAGLFGATADLVLIGVGGLDYVGLDEGARFGPLWIVALWMVFATTANVSLTWLRGRVRVAAVLGIAGGILSYVSARRLGVVAFELTDLATLLSLVLVWGIGVPLLVEAGAWLDAGGVPRAAPARLPTTGGGGLGSASRSAS